MVWNKILYYGLQIAKLFFRVRYHIVGEENLPRQAPFIVVVNHLGFLDIPLTFLALPPTTPWCLFAGESWERRPIAGRLLKWSGAIFIDRERFDRRSLNEGIKALENGGVFGLAPEGTRSKTGQMGRGRDGAAFLASRLNLQVVPIGLINTDQWEHNWPWRITQITAQVGEPFYLPDLGRRARAKELPAFTHLIMVNIAALLPERYHGYYADSAALTALKHGEDPWPACLAAEIEADTET